MRDDGGMRCARYVRSGGNREQARRVWCPRGSGWVRMHAVVVGLDRSVQVRRCALVIRGVVMRVVVMRVVVHRSRRMLGQVLMSERVPQLREEQQHADARSQQSRETSQGTHRGKVGESDPRRFCRAGGSPRPPHPSVGIANKLPSPRPSGHRVVIVFSLV